MKHEIAPQPDTRIIVRDNVYNVSSSQLRITSTSLSHLLDSSSHGSLRLSATEDPQAFLYFLQSAHGIFVPHEGVSSSVLVELAFILERYDVQTNTPPYDLVLFCFSQQTLRPAGLTTLELSQMLSVARVLGNTYVKQLLLQLFEHDSAHQATEPHRDAQIISLLANVLLKRNDLCVVVGNLLVQSARDVSVIAGPHADLRFLKAIWDKAIWILSCRPSPSKMVRSLSQLEVLPGWELYVRREEALCVIKRACKEIERWLTSELDSLDRDARGLDEDWDKFGFEQLNISSAEPSHILDSPTDSFADFDGSYMELSENEVEKLTLERAQTI